MAVFKCKMCGGTLQVAENATTAVCDYCGVPQTLPKLTDERLERLYDRADHYRRNNEYDKAMGIYEQILNETPEDAESYWSIVLCKYGIEYVEDPATGRRIPTINRAQFTSIFDDDNYVSAIKYADAHQRAIYEQEARNINEIQKGILDISQKEEPFDVFICYKETDANGRRTHDSVYANELYHELVAEGFKVFFSRITLEDKLGVAYEPYIFAALNSAKVMVVLGTKPEYFEAVWVRNEWSRYLSLIKNGEKKVLIPAYRDMDPYDLPREFSHLQAQDMNKLGFMPDLVRGIKKIVGVQQPQVHSWNDGPISHVPQGYGSGNAETLLKRVAIFLENRDWESADSYCEKVLDIDPENGQAYIYKLMAQLHVTQEKNLVSATQALDSLQPYRNALRFADAATVSRLNEYNRMVKARLAQQEKERQERLRREEQARQEQARREQERRQAEEKKRKEKAAIDAARANAANMVQNQVAEKERLERQIAEVRRREQSAADPQKMMRLARSVLACAVVVVILFVIQAAFSEIMPEAAGNFLSVIMLVAMIMHVVFSVKLLKADGRSAWLVVLNIFYGIFTTAIAILAIRKCMRNETPDFAAEIAQLQRQLQTANTQLDQSRNALRELNQKYENSK